MRTVSFLLSLLGLFAISLPTTPAYAQATRTWVSGVGDDANPCSRTAPCKTFAGAISKTASGGEIDCLDPGGFGAVTITKAITIDCNGVTGGILAALVNGVIVNAGANDKVVLRNLVIQGTSGTSIGLNGIRWLGGFELELDRVIVTGFSGLGLDVSKTAFGVLSVRNSYFAEVPTAIRMSTTAGGLPASISNTSFNFCSQNGVEAGANVSGTVSNSVFGTIGNTAILASSGGRILAADNVISTSNFGISASSAGSTIVATGNKMFGNNKAFNVAAGATFVSGNDNKVDANPGDASTSFMITK
ncbi:MAG: hypothetical protein U1E61_21320 [Bradyrhizobium sp.]